MPVSRTAQSSIAAGVDLPSSSRERKRVRDKLAQRRKREKQRSGSSHPARSLARSDFPPPPNEQTRVDSISASDLVAGSTESSHGSNVLMLYGTEAVREMADSTFSFRHEVEPSTVELAASPERPRNSDMAIVTTSPICQSTCGPLLQVNNQTKFLEPVPLLGFGQHPIHFAARFNQLGSLHILLDAGVDIDLQDSEGRAPLHVAVEAGCYNIVMALLERGAAVQIADAYGRYPTHLAVLYGYEDILKALTNHR